MRTGWYLGEPGLVNQLFLLTIIDTQVPRWKSIRKMGVMWCVMVPMYGIVGEFWQYSRRGRSGTGGADVWRGILSYLRIYRRTSPTGCKNRRTDRGDCGGNVERLGRRCRGAGGADVWRGNWLDIETLEWRVWWTRFFFIETRIVNSSAYLLPFNLHN